jgi:hypothetical protein
MSWIKKLLKPFRCNEDNPDWIRRLKKNPDLQSIYVIRSAKEDNTLGKDVFYVEAMFYSADLLHDLIDIRLQNQDDGLVRENLPVDTKILPRQYDTLQSAEAFCRFHFSSWFSKDKHIRYEPKDKNIQYIMER